MWRKELLDWIHSVEGGFVNDPTDRGGVTNMGITWRTLEQAYQMRIVDYTDVRQLNYEDAAKIYQVMYYNASKANLMDEPLDIVHFDAAVNHGPGNAARFLQITINDLANAKVLNVDGGIGPKTLQALDVTLDQFDLEPVINTYLLHRLFFYLTIINNDRNQLKFIRGWMNRVAKLKAFTG